MKRIAVVAPFLMLGACSALSTTSTLPAVPAADTARIEARIVSACTADGVFRPVVKAGVTIAVPVGTVPLSVLEEGIDKICADPDRYAGYVGTAEWVLKGLRDILTKQSSAVPAG